MASDPFAAYLVKSESDTPEDDPFASYLVQEEEPKKKESIPRNINRQILRSGARAAETVLGAPRAVGELLESIIPEKALKKGAEKIGLGKPVSKALELTKKHAPYKLLPKSEDIRENVTKFIFGKDLEPKNEWERKADEVVSDFAALALPLPGSQLKLLKPALLSIGGNLSSELVGQMGGSEKQKSYAKLGTIITGSLFNPKAAENLKTDLYQKAAQSLPEDATVSSRPLRNSLERLTKDFQKGGQSSADKPALDQISHILEEMQGEQIPIDVLQEIKKKINIVRGGLYKQLEGNKPGIKTAHAKLNKVSKAVDDALTLYGKTNPQWEAYYRPANEVHGAIEQSKRVRNNIEKVLKRHGSHAVLPLLGIGHFGGAPAIGGLAATLGTGAAAVNAGEILAKTFKSPTLRKHYTELIKAAMRDDAVAINQALKKIEKESED